MAWEPQPTKLWWWLAEDPLIRTRSHDHESWWCLTTKSAIWHHHGLLRADIVSPGPDAAGDAHNAAMMLYEDTVSTRGA